jgi:predicted aspartyl protease
MLGSRRERGTFRGNSVPARGGGPHMIDDMGIFRTEIGIAALDRPQRIAMLQNVMVDTGSEYSWLPGALLSNLGVVPVRVDAFETADRRVIDRPVGFAHVSAGGRTGASAVVFAEAGDMILLGAHGLEALNLRIDLNRKELTPAGPAPAAAAA